MATKDQADKLSRALQEARLAEPVQVTHAEDRISILCRVSREAEPKWLDMLKTILISSEEESKEVHSWKCHFCRNYFLKEVGGEQKMVFGWNFSIASKEMGHSLALIIRLLHGEKIRHVNNKELEEFPLHASANRNEVKKGRGVHKIGDGEFHPGKSGK